MSPRICSRTWRAAVITSVVGLVACQAETLADRFEAGGRPSRAYCAFGAETPQLAAYCARLNFGPDATMMVLRAENARILRAAAGRLRCADHVQLASDAMESYGADYAVTPIYSCDRDAPVEGEQKVCHVSLLVTEVASGTRFVMDNGHVLDPAVWGGASTYEEFRRRVDYAWTGTEPSWARLGRE